MVYISFIICYNKKNGILEPEGAVLMENETIMLERKQKITDFVEDQAYSPMKRKEIVRFFQVPQEERELFDEIINQLIKEGKVVETKKGKIMSTKSLNMLVGTFLSHSKGFGFAQTGEGDDTFIPADSVNGAMHRDKILFRIAKPAQNGKRAEGAVIQVIERGARQIVGTYEQNKDFGFVLPDDKKIAQDIFIPKENSKGAVTGHKVVVDITKYGENRRNPEGKIIEILGHINDPGVDILSIIRQFDLPVDFPKEVYTQIESIPSELSEQDLEGRTDLRQLLMITIDGEDAKDLDDAVSLNLLSNGNYELGVHIADVSHYVKEHSPMDKEAFLRGTSVYLVDRVIPMLPHKLSNGICSLNPQVDRLALSCIMEIDRKGMVVSHNILKTVIHSNHRMTYTAVREILEDKTPALLEEYADVVPMIENMNRLRELLGEKRKKRGSVNFDLPESKIFLNEDGVPLEIKPYERSIATNLIEEFMLVCNETIAEDFFWQETPFLFRNHEAPDEEKLEKLEQFIKSFGYRLKISNDEIHPKAVQQVLEQVEGKEEERLITRITLRSMKQARYMAENQGHFGLAAKYYCHFTSPIRRYPDLEIHRIIKLALDGELAGKKLKSLQHSMPEIAKRCSVRERVAEDAERQTDTLKKVQYMEERIGEIYEGIISGVTNWGIYVELPNTIEGMISLNHLDDDFYIFDEVNMLVYGRHSKKRFRLGDHVLVQVAKVSVALLTIDFVFAPNELDED